MPAVPLVKRTPAEGRCLYHSPPRLRRGSILQPATTARDHVSASAAAVLGTGQYPYLRSLPFSPLILAVLRADAHYGFLSHGGLGSVVSGAPMPSLSCAWRVSQGPRCDGSASLTPQAAAAAASAILRSIAASLARSCRLVASAAVKGRPFMRQVPSCTGSRMERGALMVVQYKYNVAATVLSRRCAGDRTCEPQPQWPPGRCILQG